MNVLSVMEAAGMTVSTGMDHSVVPATKVTLWTKTASFVVVRFHNLLEMIIFQVN